MSLVDLAVKSILVACLGAALASLLRKSSAATRHLLLALTLLGICLLPAVTKVAPTWSVPFLISKATPRPSTDSVMIPTSEYASADPIREVALATSATPKFNFEFLLAGVWALVATCIGGAVLVRLIRLRRLENTLAMTGSPVLNAAVAELCATTHKHVLLLVGEEGRSPMTWGHNRPVLLLPADAETWPIARLRSVILHELGHIERSDWLIGIFARLVTAAFWFNPIVWFIARRLEMESEIAADDRVLAQGVPAPQYASHLLELVRQLSGSRSPDRTALSMAHPASSRRGRLDARICSILESRRSRRTARGFALITPVLSIAAAVGIIGAATPTVVKSIGLKSSQPGVKLVVTNAASAPVRVALALKPLEAITTAPIACPTVKKQLTLSVKAHRRQSKLHSRVDLVRVEPAPPAHILSTPAVAPPPPTPEKVVLDKDATVELSNVDAEIRKAFDHAEVEMHSKGDRRTNRHKIEAAVKAMSGFGDLIAKATQLSSRSVQSALEKAAKELDSTKVKMDCSSFSKEARAEIAKARKEALKASTETDD